MLFQYFWIYERHTVQETMLFCYKKPEAYETKGCALEWLWSYLSNGSQCVRIGKFVSDAKIITIGNP